MYQVTASQTEQNIKLVRKRIKFIKSRFIKFCKQTPFL